MNLPGMIVMTRVRVARMIDGTFRSAKQKGNWIQFHRKKLDH